MNQKYSSYHNLIQCCSDFGFMPNIVLCTMENSLIYRFCQEKIGIGIDADVHPEKELLAGLRKIELYDDIPWIIWSAVKIQLMIKLFPDFKKSAAIWIKF